MFSFKHVQPGPSPFVTASTTTSLLHEKHKNLHPLRNCTCNHVSTYVFPIYPGAERFHPAGKCFKVQIACPTSVLVTSSLSRDPQGPKPLTESHLSRLTPTTADKPHPGYLRFPISTFPPPANNQPRTSREELLAGIYITVSSLFDG